MSSKTPQLLFDEVINLGLISQDVGLEIEKEAADSGKDFSEVLLSRKVITDEDLLAVKSRIYGLPIIKAADIEFDKELSQDVSEDIISFYKFLPFARNNSILKVALTNPENIDALEALKFIASGMGLMPEKYLISYKDFDILRRNYRTLTTEVNKALKTISEEETKGQLNISEKVGGLEEITAEAPVTRIVAVVVKHAVETKASDIHIEPFEKDIRLRFRIDGIMQVVLTLPIKLHSALVTRIKILSELKIDETRLAQDGRFSTKFNDRTVDFRVSTFPTRNGEKIVLRILDPFVGNIKLPELGLEGRSLKLVSESIRKPYGALLITGPTGSGKSTTLAAILREVNDDEVNTVTLEDPIEYYVDGVNQSQIHEEIGYTFASGLRHILRQDPDIIMVGEIRDGETAALAIQASLTGHVVLSTLHTNDTIGVIPRLIDMGVEKYLIAPTLNLAIAQRLTRKLCQACREKVKANPAEEAMIKKAILLMPEDLQKQLPKENFEIYKPGTGDCKECNGKRYKGRIAVFEALEMTDELEKIILTDISETKLKEEAKRQGMISMFQDGIIKVLKGITSFEELLQVAQLSEEE